MEVKNLKKCFEVRVKAKAQQVMIIKVVLRL